VKDSSDELSTADLAGQSAGSGTADERAVRDDGTDRTGERHDGFPGDRMTDAGYADDRGANAQDRTYADDRPFADDTAMSTGRADDATMSTGRADDATMSTGRGGYVDDAAAMTNDRAGFSDGVVGDRADYPGDTGVADGTTGYADDAAMSGAGSGVGRTGVVGTGATGSGNGVVANEAGPLLASAEAEGFRARWTDVQTGFVDEPRRAVEQADALTAELMQYLAKTFADERVRLESQWDRGEDIHTDDLRAAFQRYRSFFERLLST
jgi:hypothetical protein